MNKKIAFLILVILFLVVILFIGQHPSVNVFKHHRTGFAPDFTLKDTYGKKITLSSFKGSPVVIFFGTTWCPQCRIEMIALKARYDQYAPLGLKIIYIDINESAERVSRFAQQNSYPGMVLLDLDGSVAYEYDVKGVPAIILVDGMRKIKGEGKKMSDLSFDELFPSKNK